MKSNALAKTNNSELSPEEMAAAAKIAGNFEGYTPDEEDLKPENKVAPYFQFLNPQSVYKGQPGLAIKAEIAESIGFQPTASWKQTTAKFGGNYEEFWVSQSPNLIILKRSRKLASVTTEENYEIRDYESHKQWYFQNLESLGKERVKNFVSIVCVPVDENHSPIALEPIKCRLLKQVGRDFTEAHSNFWGGYKTTVKKLKIMGVNAASEPWMAVFKPQFAEGFAETSDGKKSSASLRIDADGFTPVTVLNFDDLVIQPNNPLHSEIKIFRTLAEEIIDKPSVQNAEIEVTDDRPQLTGVGANYTYSGEDIDEDWD